MMGKHLQYSDRVQFERLLKQNRSIDEIARIMGRSRSSLFAERKRGLTKQYGKDYEEIHVYTAEAAQRDADWKGTGKGAALKIGCNHALAHYIADRILIDGWSPDVIAGRMKLNPEKHHTLVSTRTIYSYIDLGLIPGVTRKNLRYPNRKRKSPDYVRHTRKKNVLYRSIHERPEDVLQRRFFGHWEMDTVVGKAAGTNHCFLVLTERFSRYEIIVKLFSKTQAAVKLALDRLEQANPCFQQIFKTITVDNGCEFSQHLIEQSLMNDKERTTAYFCDPYSSWQRGTNENQNKMIRWFVRKGVDITQVPNDEVCRIQNWMNNYPRKILGYKSPAELLELHNISIET